MSESVTVLPTSPDDFFNYDKLFKDMYDDLAGKAKNNHIFSCCRDVEVVTCLTLHQSNLDNHAASTHKISKMSRKFESLGAEV